MSSSAPICSICLENLANGTPLSTLECGHRFHAACSFELLRKPESKCPERRGPLTFTVNPPTEMDRLLYQSRDDDDVLRIVPGDLRVFLTVAPRAPATDPDVAVLLADTVNSRRSLSFMPEMVERLTRYASDATSEGFYVCAHMCTALSRLCGDPLPHTHSPEGALAVYTAGVVDPLVTAVVCHSKDDHLNYPRTLPICENGSRVLCAMSYLPHKEYLVDHDVLDVLMNMNRIFGGGAEYTSAGMSSHKTGFCQTTITNIYEGIYNLTTVPAGQHVALRNIKQFLPAASPIIPSVFCRILGNVLSLPEAREEARAHIPVFLAMLDATFKGKSDGAALCADALRTLRAILTSHPSLVEYAKNEGRAVSKIERIQAFNFYGAERSNLCSEIDAVLELLGEKRKEGCTAFRKQRRRITRGRRRSSKRNARKN